MWSRNTPESGANETRVLHRVVRVECRVLKPPLVIWRGQAKARGAKMVRMAKQEERNLKRSRPASLGWADYSCVDMMVLLCEFVSLGAGKRLGFGYQIGEVE